MANHLADILQSTKFSHLAGKVRGCHKSFRGFVVQHGHQCGHHRELLAKPKASCDVRLCPFEARERSMRMQHKFGDLIASKHNAKYAVFHLPSREDLAQGLAELWEAFAALRKHPYWKGHVRGCVVALEITYKNGWHPHLNVLIDCPAYLNRQMLGDAWRDASGCPRAFTPWLQRANKGTVRELLKYVTKLGDLVDHDSPELIEQFLESTHGRRFIRTYGCFYGIPNPEDAEDDAGCPHCGAQLHLFAHTLYLHQVRLDEQGVWRPLDYALPPERGKPYTPLEPKSVVLPIPKNQMEEIWQQQQLQLNPLP